MKKTCLKMICTIVIRENRGIQWDRSQLRVLKGPLYFFFYSFGVILQPEYYYSVKMPKFLIEVMCSNFATRMQEVRLHGQNILSIPCLVCSPQVGVCKVPMDKGLPCAITL
jgi:hypothetical protein